MSTMPIAPEMTLGFAMTRPVVNSATGLVVEDFRRCEFQTWDRIWALDGLRVATSDNLATRRFLQQELPAAEPLIFKDNADLDDLLKSRPVSFDALLMQAEEGAAWTIRYPHFNLVVPSPVRLVPFGCAARPGDTEVLNFFDAWLLNAKGDGTVHGLYRYWMLGELDEVRPPRWSVVGDILAWFK
jgi:ABC-type amino acid transport substrate-binding protein